MTIDRFQAGMKMGGSSVTFTLLALQWREKLCYKLMGLRKKKYWFEILSLRCLQEIEWHLANLGHINILQEGIRVGNSLIHAFIKSLLIKSLPGARHYSGWLDYSRTANGQRAFLLEIYSNTGDRQKITNLLEIINRLRMIGGVILDRVVLRGRGAQWAWLKGQQERKVASSENWGRTNKRKCGRSRTWENKSKTILTYITKDENVFKGLYNLLDNLFFSKITKSISVKWSMEIKISNSIFLTKLNIPGILVQYEICKEECHTVFYQKKMNTHSTQSAKIEFIIHLSTYFCNTGHKCLKKLHPLLCFCICTPFHISLFFCMAL